MYVSMYVLYVSMYVCVGGEIAAASNARETSRCGRTDVTDGTKDKV